MTRWIRRAMVLGIIAIGLSSAGPRAQADQPQYLLLGPTYGGTGQVVNAPSYSYGWFGVAPREHYTWHWSYYNFLWLWR